MYNIYTYIYIYMAGACATETQLPSMRTMRSKAHDGPCALLTSPMFLRPTPQNAEARDRLVELHVFACQGEQ